MPEHPEVQGFTIVLRGNFNPAIFHPSWFFANDLIRKDEADSAKLQLVHPQASIFQTEWLEFNCSLDRFQISTPQSAYYEAVRDLAVGVLRILSHIPMNFLGINRQFHYKVDSEDTWHRIGHRLAPKADWEGLLKQPGMRTLTIESQRPDSLEGYFRVTVEPSVRVHPGVYIATNDHFVLSPSDPSPTAPAKVIDILAEHWSLSMHRSQAIAQHIANLEE